MIKTLYKAEEPFMEVKNGHGYQGVLMYDDISDKVQCHICGLWYEHVGRHTYLKHKISADDYKIKYGLTLRTALCSVGLSSRRRELTNMAISKGTIRPDIASRVAAYNHKKNRSCRQKGTRTTQYFNKSGLCELQIKTRYQVVQSIVGRDPTQNEIIKYDKKLFFCGIVPRFKNINNFRVSIGAETRQQGESGNKINNVRLIAMLRKFYRDNKTTPKVTDFMPRHKAFYRAFGSWSNALRSAGIK